VVAFLFSLALAVASFRLSYGAIELRLVQLYGAPRVSRYFTPAVFASAMVRIRLAAGILIAIAVGSAGLRNWMSRGADQIWGALSLGFRHARRARIQWNVPRVCALCAVMLISLFVRLQFIGQPMRYDEADTVLGYASQPLYLGLSIYNEPNNHLFHTMLVHGAILMAGTAEWAVRLPALVAGILICPLAYLLALRLAGATAALWTAAFVAASSALVEYSTNARGYTLICCATLGLLISGYQILRSASPWWFAVFGLAAVIGFWTIPIFLIPFGGAILWMGWESLSRHRYFRHIYWIRLTVVTTIAGAVTLLAYSPVALVNGPGALLNNQWVAPRNLQGFLAGNLARFRETWEMWTRDMPAWWAWGMAAAFFLCLCLFPALRRLIVSLIAWTLVLFAARRFVPFARNWLLFLPIFLMGAAAGLAWMAERLVPSVRRDFVASATAVLLAALLAVPVLQNRSVLASTETGVLRSAPEIAAFLAAAHISPDRVFRSTTSELPLEYYLWRQTGTRPGKPNVQAFNQEDVGEAWFLLNGAYEETLPSITAKYRLQSVRVLETKLFERASLYHLAWSRQ
jgi:hypothetical protein